MVITSFYYIYWISNSFLIWRLVCSVKNVFSCVWSFVCLWLFTSLNELIISNKHILSTQKLWSDELFCWQLLGYFEVTKSAHWTTILMFGSYLCLLKYILWPLKLKDQLELTMWANVTHRSILHKISKLETLIKCGLWSKLKFNVIKNLAKQFIVANVSVLWVSPNRIFTCRCFCYHTFAAMVWFFVAMVC